MRTKNSLINIVVSCLSYAIIMVGSFVTKRLFVSTLGFEVLGIETAFLNVVSALAIVELGLGVGIVYKLYKPIAEKNWEQVATILCFLRKCYIVISIVMGVLGLISSYFIVMPMQSDFSKIWLVQIFMLYVADVLVSYLYSHKRAMFIADQKNYVNNIIHVSVQILLFIAQIAVLKIFASFEMYLICKIFFRLTENLIISYRFDKKYSFINLKTKNQMPAFEKKGLFKNMKALLFHKVAGVGATTISSLIILYGVSLSQNGIYGNYMLIVMALTTVTNEVFNGIIASFGNLLSTSDVKKVYRNFNILYFLNFLLYSFIVTAFICLATPFINIWTGAGSAFNMRDTVFIAGYLYIYGIRQSIGMAKTSVGMYDEDKYLALLGAFITFVCSYLLVEPLGVSGVMLGNIIGIMSVSYWAQPYLVYENVFRKSVLSYHVKFIFYTVLTIFYAYFTYNICDIFGSKFGITSYIANFLGTALKISQNYSGFISQIFVNGTICLLIPNILNVILFFKTNEFKGLCSAVQLLLKKFKSR